MPISPELQAKIDALPYEGLKADLLHTFDGPRTKHGATDEEIFETAVSGYMGAKEQQARLRQWQDEEVLSFVEHFKKEMPEGYAEFLRQEREDHEIGDIWWDVRALAERWLPGLDWSDYGTLLGKVRDLAQANLI